METKYYIGHTKNEDDRWKASSGGIGTAITRYLLSQPEYGTSVTFRFDTEKCIYEPVLVYDASDINVCGSVYQEIDIPRYLKENIDWIKGGIIVSCTPCQVASVRQILGTNGIPHFIISFCCSGQTTIEGTWKYYELLGIDKSQVTSIQYRGNGWPSGIQIWLKDGTIVKRDNYTEPWATLKQSHLYQPERCFYCGRDTGRNADIALADPWLKEYMEQDTVGSTLLLANTTLAKDILDEMQQLSLISCSPTDYAHYATAQKNNITTSERAKQDTRHTKRLLRLTSCPCYFNWATRTLGNMRMHIKISRWLRHMKWLLFFIYAFIASLDASAQYSHFHEIVPNMEWANDWSDSTKVVWQEPTRAYVNITGIEEMPQSKYKKKYINMHAWMEVYDGNGNYFKKRVLLNGQGQTSMSFDKKNFAADFCEDEWIGNETTSITIGDWVSQDAFHFKAFYTDYFRGLGIVSYKLYDQITADRPSFAERAGIKESKKAKYHPDAFPCIVFLNDDFYGIFAWQLKKHRKNMNMDKNTAENIHIDGDLRDDFIFRGNIDWTRFEIRNPKGLFCTDTGADIKCTEYNGDKPQELIDSDMPCFDPNNDKHVLTDKVKRYLMAMARYWEELNSLEESGADSNTLRDAIAERYDIESLIDYYIHLKITMNNDGIYKNWQWFTYDGTKWFVTPYDLDQTYGMTLEGGTIRPATFTTSIVTSGPLYWIQKYYLDDLKERYTKIRKDGSLSAESWSSLVYDWYDRIGDQNYTLETVKWPDSPCYRETICAENWTTDESLWAYYNKCSTYSNDSTYHAGNLCKTKGRVWKATGTTKGVLPYVFNGFIDSPERVTSWIEARLAHLDKALIPQANTITETYNICIPKGIYNLDGTKKKVLTKGVNIIQHENGNAIKLLVR